MSNITPKIWIFHEVNTGKEDRIAIFNVFPFTFQCIENLVG